MNKTSFKKIFSKRLNALVAVGENAKADGKAPGAASSVTPPP
ncbi:MAG: ESPR domain-containing protein [Methylobacillus sp.]|nr:ESPR domain-containing protein [Methylobacillus sp.]